MHLKQCFLWSQINSIPYTLAAICYAPESFALHKRPPVTGLNTRRVTVIEPWYSLTFEQTEPHYTAQVLAPNFQTRYRTIIKDVLHATFT